MAPSVSAKLTYLEAPKIPETLQLGMNLSSLDLHKPPSKRSAPKQVEPEDARPPAGKAREAFLEEIRAE